MQDIYLVFNRNLLIIPVVCLLPFSSDHYYFRRWLALVFGEGFLMLPIMAIIIILMN